MAFNNEADTGYHDSRAIDRLYSLQDNTSKTLSDNTRELGELKTLLESVFREVMDLKNEKAEYHSEIADALKDHDSRILSLEKYQVKMNTARNVIISMLSIGSLLIGYWFFFVRVST